MQFTQASRCSVTTGARRKCFWWRVDPKVEKFLRALASTLALLTVCLASIAAEGCVLMTGFINLSNASHHAPNSICSSLQKIPRGFSQRKHRNHNEGREEAGN